MEPPRSNERDLDGVAVGGRPGADIMVSEAYQDLRRVAHLLLATERTGHTLQTTALAHEAYARIAKGRDTVLRDRSHLLALAARTIRQILVDHARRSSAQKRGGGRARVSMAEAARRTVRGTPDVLVLHEGIESLARLDPREARVVECRYFGGMSVQEIADHLQVSPRTVDADLAHARAWLRVWISRE